MFHDVVAEHARGRLLRQAQLDAFAADGVPALHLAKDWEGVYGFVNSDRVVFDGARFEFERYAGEADATRAFTFLVYDEMGEPADVAAWRDTRLALWLGRVAMLGQEQVYLPRLGDPLTVHADPLGWLRANRAGVVIVDYQRAAPLLRESGTIATADAAHARELRHLLTTPPPRVVVAPPRAILHHETVELAERAEAA